MTAPIVLDKAGPFDVKACREWSQATKVSSQSVDLSLNNPNPNHI